jgi:hypothetical protein
MPSPWLNVPLADYEGHMSSAGVQQLGALSDLFAEALAISRHESVAILGIAGGNGLDRIDWSVTRSVLGIDINPSYLEAVRRRYPLRGLELLCADLSEEITNSEPTRMVHAALVFEHAGTGRCFDNAVSLVAPGGRLSVVLQIPSESAQPVSSTPFASVQSLKSQFSLVDAGWVRCALEGRDFRLIHQVTRPLVSGKSFWMGIFQRAAT